MTKRLGYWIPHGDSGTCKDWSNYISFHDVDKSLYPRNYRCHYLCDNLSYDSQTAFEVRAWVGIYNALEIVNASTTLQWRHNEHDGVSDHQPHECLLNDVFRLKSKKPQRSAPLAFVRGIHRCPVKSPHKGPVTWKMFPFDDVIMNPCHYLSKSRLPNEQLRFPMSFF